jgi:alcohol dehydrogenase (cytochrome c)
VAAVAACGGGDERPADPAELGAAAAWPSPNGDVRGTRAADSEIDAGNVGELHRAWSFPIQAEPRTAGSMAANPVILDDTVYVQDLLSNVFALDSATGRPRWEKRYDYGNPGPNGVAAGYGLLYGVTDTSVFALERQSGRLRWIRRVLGPTENWLEVAPVVANGLVYVSTVGFAPGGRGGVYALDARNGRVRWRFDTIKDGWQFPDRAGGGGAWFPVSVDEQGRVYLGNSNPGPWGGTGDAFPGPALYTNSLIVLDGRSGRLLWHDQVTPHDVRDYDFQATPILAEVGGRDVVFGAGKAGRVLAWDRVSRERLWERDVGLHRNDRGPLPEKPATICPGLYGGVETPMAHADGRLYVPVVDLCVTASVDRYQALHTVDPFDGAGRMVALDDESGEVVWDRRLPLPVFSCATVSNDVVFTATFDGTVYALAADDGRTLWSAKARAGINACPAVAGDLLVIGAGVALGDESELEVVAFRVPG